MYMSTHTRIIYPHTHAHTHTHTHTHRNIGFQAPYKVQQEEDELLQTYLDTVGRPVVVVKASNLVEQYIQDFTVRSLLLSLVLYIIPAFLQLTYEFQTWMLLQEPLLVVVALYGFFLLIIVIVRLDFSITKVTNISTTVKNLDHQNLYAKNFEHQNVDPKICRS